MSNKVLEKVYNVDEKQKHVYHFVSNHQLIDRLDEFKMQIEEIQENHFDVTDA